MKIHSALFSICVAAITAALTIITSCKTGEPKDPLTGLTAKETRLVRERDSLMQIIVQKSQALDTKTADLNNVAAEKTALEAKHKNLQAGYSKKGDQLKKAEASNRELTNTVIVQSARNDSLLNEMNILRERVEAIDAEMTKAQTTNASMAESLKQQEEKRKTDSVLLANRPKPFVVRENGFIDIIEIGGGLGLGNTSVDYSRSLISLTNVFGYSINRHYLAGIGTGVNFYNGGTMVPLYIDMRYSFNGNKVIPFISADGGVLFTLSDLSSTGIFINPAFGLSKELNKKIFLEISAGYLLQEAPSGMRNSFAVIKGGVSFSGKR
jgi:hypothetical protein